MTRTNLEAGSTADFLAQAQKRALQPDDTWRTLLKECVFCVGSEATGHIICVLIALANAAAGGATAAAGHDMTTSLLVGTSIYAASVVTRYALSGGKVYPSFKAAALSLTLGLVVSAGIGKALEHYHRQEITHWYQALSEDERQQVRGRVRIWMDKQNPTFLPSLTAHAQAFGFKFTEDYIILNLCMPTDKELMAISDDARSGKLRRTTNQPTISPRP